MIGTGRVGGVLLLIGNPCRKLPVIFEPGRAFQIVFGRVHDQAPFVVVLVGDMDGVERNGDVFFAGTQETADADDQRSHPARLSTSTSMISPILLFFGS